jgi:hypothetical protein
MYHPGDTVLVDGEIQIVKAYHEDACGWGCCSAYELEGEDGQLHWPSTLSALPDSSESEGE